jgi:hypothetical protein
MHLMHVEYLAAGLALLIAGLIVGCGENAQPVVTDKPKVKSSRAAPPDDQDGAPTEVAVARREKRRFQPVQLGGAAGDAPVPTSPAKSIDPDENRAQAIIQALQPLQVLLGEWRWTTRKEFGGSKKSAEDLTWVWDFQTDATQPSLTAKSTAHPYFQQVWLTYLPDDEKYQTTAKSPDGQTRVFRGTWTSAGEPREESDGKKVQHTFKMQLSQVAPDDGDQWQLVFNQLDNNQYLMDLTRRPVSGKQFAPLDVVRQQRLGTSFAVADSDNPGPKCIISGGLGTMSVNYRGKTYPVCCSGCAAAFNDDPERWLAKLAQREKAKKSSQE